MRNVLELAPVNFNSTRHMRTNSVQAEGSSSFCFAALIRPFQDLSTEVPLLGNSTDLAATNGWMLSVSTTPGSAASPSITNVNFKARDSAGATRNATVAIPAGYAVGSRPIAVVGKWYDGDGAGGDGECILYVNGQLMDTVPVVAFMVPGTGRFCIGSMPGAAGTNFNSVSVISAAYAAESITARNAALLIQSMLETGEILAKPDFAVVPTWSNHYSMQRSALRRFPTMPILRSVIVQSTDLSAVTIANLGTLGTAGDLAAFGAPTALVQSCPLAIGNG